MTSQSNATDAPAPPPPPPPPHNEEIFQQLESYPYASDPDFQGGLAAILGATPDEHSREHLTLRAKCFYFARKKGVRIDFEAYKAWILRRDRWQPHEEKKGSTESREMNAIDAGHKEGNAEPSTSEKTRTDSELAAPYPTSFSDIVGLISTGQPVRGIKNIPDTVLEGQASQSRATRRQKPWEQGNDG